MVKKLNPRKKQLRYIQHLFDTIRLQILPLEELDDLTLNTIGRVFGMIIYELTPHYSGNASVNALIEKYNKGKNWSKEHQWPRQLIGERIIRRCWEQRDHMTSDRLCEILTDELAAAVVINYTTKEENDALRPFQKESTWVSPEHAYQQAGIKLLQWPRNLRIEKLPDKHPDLIPMLNRKIPKKSTEALGTSLSLS